MATQITVRKRCSCGDELVSTGEGMTRGFMPTKWRHRCKACGKDEDFERSYPATEIEFDKYEVRWE